MPTHPLPIVDDAAGLEGKVESEREFSSKFGPSLESFPRATRLRIRLTIYFVFPFPSPEPTCRRNGAYRLAAVLVSCSVALTGCLFSGGSSVSSGESRVGGTTTTAVGTPSDASLSAATVPDSSPAPGQPAPTVSPSEAEAAQLAVAASTTSSIPRAISPITSLLPTASSGLRTPEAASRNLWDSWQDKDRERAVLYASVDAVNALFVLPWTPETVDQGCHTGGGAGVAATCLFVQGSVVKVLNVAGSADFGYKVDRVTTARQNTPLVSILPNISTDPFGATSVVPIGPVIDENGNLVDPALSGSTGVSAATVVGTPAGATGGTSSGGPSTQNRSRSRRPKSPTTVKSRTAKPATSDGGAAPSPTADATPASTSPSNTGVRTGAPVVNQVEG